MALGLDYPNFVNFLTHRNIFLELYRECLNQLLKPEERTSTVNSVRPYSNIMKDDFPIMFEILSAQIRRHTSCKWNQCLLFSIAVQLSILLWEVCFAI